MSASLLREAIVYSKYAHNIPGTGKRESWDQAVDRMMGMHRRHFKHLKDPRVNETLDRIGKSVKQYNVMPSMRALQNGGKGIERKHSRMYNCAFTHIDRPRALIELFWMLLSGCGTGFSVQEHHVRKLPQVIQPTKKTIVWTIQDSIEGWAYALGAILASYNLVSENVVIADDKQLFPLRGHVVQFNYSKIRDKGSLLSSSNGLAPGPDGLREALETIRKLLSSVGDRQLRPIEVSDIALIVAEAVMSGGVRRSASIILFSPWDMEMLNYKTSSDWYITHPWRARANISALLLRNCDEKHVPHIQKLCKTWGEPAIIWTWDREIGYNPCVEIGLYPRHYITGASGWQVCNLTSINLTSCTDEDDFLERCYIAAALGTFQAAYTDLDFLGEVTKEIVRREALIGVSMTGVFDRLNFINNPTLLRKGAHVVKTANEAIAHLIGINPAARCTAIKPEGTSSLVCMSSSGIHPRHSPEYLRRATYSEGEPVLDILLRDAPELLEKVYYPSPSGPVFNGYRFITLIESPNKDVTEQTVKALETLEVVKTFKKYWVDEGTNLDRCVNKTVRHNVSNTIKLEPEEYDEVFAEILAQKDLFNGISVLAKTGDLEYIACPHTHVYPCEEILDMVREAFEANEYWKVEDILVAKSGLDKLELRKQYNKLWADRCRAFNKPVTWSLDHDVAVNHNETIACAGGACELI